MRLRLLFRLNFILILGWAYGVQAILSFIVGNAIGVLPGLLFGWLFLKKTRPLVAKQVVKVFYYGEALKWIITGVLLALAFSWQAMDACFLLFGFISSQTQWFTNELI